MAAVLAGILLQPGAAVGLDNVGLFWLFVLAAIAAVACGGGVGCYFTLLKGRHVAPVSTAVIGTIIAILGSYVLIEMIGTDLWPVIVMIPVGAIAGRFVALSLHGRVAA